MRSPAPVRLSLVPGPTLTLIMLCTQGAVKAQIWDTAGQERWAAPLRFMGDNDETN